MKTVLIVDDEPDIVELVKNRLEANAYRVLTAVDGQDGIRKVQQEKPDLIVMDIMMPNMTGGDAVKVLKTDPLTKFIPILFLTAVTANMPEESRRINVEGQFFSSVSKPFKPDRLMMEIIKLIGSP